MLYIATIVISNSLESLLYALTPTISAGLGCILCAIAESGNGSTYFRQIYVNQLICKNDRLKIFKIASTLDK